MRHALLSFLLLVHSGCTATVDSLDQDPKPVAYSLSSARTPDGQYVSWREHLIDSQDVNGGLAIRGGDGLKMADFDQDGFDDIVAVHEDNNYVRIAFGSADPDVWELVTLAEGDEAPAPEDVSIGDANNDGWLDIIVACELSHLIYFQSPGDVDAIRSGMWPRTMPAVTRDRGSWIRAFFADYDGDGKLEVSAANKGDQLPAGGGRPDSFEAKETSWFGLPDNPLAGDDWQEHVLSRVKLPMNAQPVDLDGDGDLDIFGGSRFEMRPFWFENRGGSPPEFIEHRITVRSYNVERLPEGQFAGKWLTSMNAVFADLNGDGRLDIILQETPLVVSWLEQPASFDEPWPLHKIGDLGPDTSTGLALADINGDGRADLFTGGYSQNPRDHDGEDITVHSRTGRLAWWQQPEDPKQEWTLHNVSRRKRGMYDDFIVRDMDGDGDIDFVTTRGNSGTFDGLIWLEQLRTPGPTQSFHPARESESAHLALP